MGGPMARHLAAKGHAVTVWNRTEAKASAWAAANTGKAAATPAEAAKEADVVIVAVVNAQQVEAVLYGEGGAVGALREGGLVMQCATCPAAFVEILPILTSPTAAVRETLAAANTESARTDTAWTEPFVEETFTLPLVVAIASRCTDWSAANVMSPGPSRLAETPGAFR